MDKMPKRKYHIVQFLGLPEKSRSLAYTVPASWIRGEIESSETVLLAYPKESWEITRERVKNYEDPGKDWESNLAQIKYSAGELYDLLLFNPKIMKVIPLRCYFTWYERRSNFGEK